MAKTTPKAFTETAAKTPKPKKVATAPAKAKATEKPKKAKKPAPKPAEPKKSVLRQTSDAVAQLASDILADRIVPTIEQIKSVAASALGQDQTKGKRAKAKKK